MITQTLCAMVREGAAVGGGGRGPAPAITVLSAVLGCTMAGTLTDKLAILGHLPVGVRAFAATPPVTLGPYPTGSTAAPLLFHAPILRHYWVDDRRQGGIEAASHMCMRSRSGKGVW
jgi:hypothetical protein